jgi:hypothetical protein
MVAGSTDMLYSLLAFSAGPGEVAQNPVASPMTISPHEQHGLWN